MNVVSNATVTKIQVAAKIARKPSRQAARKASQQAIAGSAICVVALALVGLSLTHLAHGIVIVTNAPSWEGWAMAIGIDLGFVAFEVAGMAASSDKLRRQISKYTVPGVIGTLAVSAVLNALAFAWGQSGWLSIAAACLGLIIPVAVYFLTRVGAMMWLADRRDA